MIQLRILTVIAALVTTQASNTVPVFILDDGILDGAVVSQLDPFQEVKQNAFATLMGKVKQISAATIFFIEDNLSLQDIMAKDYKGTSFPILRKDFVDKKLKMLLQVENPYSYIKSHYPSYGDNEFYLKSTVSRLRFDDSYRHTFIYFKDNGNESRIERLRKHDAIIRQVYFAIKQLSKGPVIGVYTGKHGPKDGESYDSTRSDNNPTNRMVFNCDHVKFEFYGTKLLRKEPLVPLEADGCVFKKLDQNRFAYNLHLKHDTPGQTHTYKLQFVFTHIYPNNKNAGWKAIEVNYLHEGDLKETQKLDFAVNRTTKYASVSPLIMIPSGGNFHPTLTIDKYMIFLTKSGSLNQVGIGDDNSFANETQGYKVGEHHDPKNQMHQLPEGPSEGPNENAGEDKKKVVIIILDDKDRGAAREGGGDGEGLTLTNTTTTANPETITTETAKPETDVPEVDVPGQDVTEEYFPGDDVPEMSTDVLSTRRNTNDPGILATPPLLMGFMVVALITTVLLFGVDMLMNINTNSRYDSPDTKPLFDPETVKD